MSLIHESAWIHSSALVLGRVELSDDVSVWPMAVVRGDVEQIFVGARTNIQDGAVIHADPGFPAVIGSDCVIGHRAIVHGSKLDDGVLIGMGAILLNGVRVGRGSIVGAGAVVPEGMQIPPSSLVLGVPGRVVRDLTEAQRASIVENAARYVVLSRAHKEGLFTRHHSTDPSD